MKSRAIVGLCALVLCPVLSQAQSLSNKTTTGLDLGVALSNYHYEEDVNDKYFMSLDGKKIAVVGQYTHALRGGMFWNVDGRLATGPVDYDSAGSGSKSSNPDWYLEFRGTFGRDFELGEQVLAPYVGLGLRYLMDDLRGQTSTGASGYRRSSTYVYLPLGVTHRFSAGAGGRIATTLEYDSLLSGTQRSYMTDVNGYTSDLVNRQDRGYGTRLSVAYERASWSVAAFWNTWNIDKSNTAYFASTTAIYSGYEPHNVTNEIGVQVKWRIF
jgi:hypothetical protein